MWRRYGWGVGLVPPRLRCGWGRNWSGSSIVAPICGARGKPSIAAINCEHSGNLSKNNGEYVYRIKKNGEYAHRIKKRMGGVCI